MPPKPDYYRTLQVDPSAEPEVITAAFRRLARKYHPDVSGDPAATARMAHLNDAYETLSNPEARRRYDIDRLGRQPSPHAGQTAADPPARPRQRHAETSAKRPERPRQRRATHTETSAKRPERPRAETSEDATTRTAKGGVRRGTIFWWLVAILFALSTIAKIVNILSE